MSKHWQPYAQHILDSIAKIRRIQARGDLMQDDILYDATLRNLQTLFEATQQLPDEQKQRQPSIPWKQISGFRNILVHAYLGDIDPRTVQGVVEQYLDSLKHAIRSMLSGEGSDRGAERPAKSGRSNRVHPTETSAFRAP